MHEQPEFVNKPFDPVMPLRPVGGTVLVNGPAEAPALENARPLATIGASGDGMPPYNRLLADDACVFPLTPGAQRRVCRP